MKIKFTHFILIVLLNLIGNFSLAQTDGQDFVIDLSGEIVLGEVQKTLDPRRFKVLNFSSEKLVESKFRPEDILGFGLANGARYRSADNPVNGEKVFFEEIIVGERSLLSHEGHLFIELKEGLRRLEFRSKKEVEMKSVKTQSFGYIGVLTYGLGNNMEYDFVESIRNVPPRKGAIKEIVKEYHKLNGLDYVEYGAVYPFVKVSPNVGIGYHHIVPKVSGSRATVHPVKSSLAINALVDFHLVRDAPRVFFTSGLIFQKFQSIMDISIPVMGGRFYVYEDFDISSIGLPVLFNYYLVGNNRFKIHSGIGMNYRVQFKNTNESHTEARRGDGTLIGSYSPQQLNTGNRIGMLGRLGVTTTITSKTALVLEGQIHSSQFGDVFAYSPNLEHAASYKYTFNGYSLNAAIKF